MNRAAAEAQNIILNGPDCSGRRWLLERLRLEAERNRIRLEEKTVPPVHPLRKPKFKGNGQPIMFDVNDPEMQGGMDSNP